MSQKRSFGIDTTSLATAAPILPNGVYAGQLVNCSITMGQGDNLKDLIDIQKEQKWDKDSKKFIELDNYILTGMLNYGVLLLSKKAINLLQLDEPRVYGGRINLKFNQETCQMEPNHVLGAFLEATGLKSINFKELAENEWEYDENIEIPEHLQNTPNIVDMLNALAYHRIFFNLICQSVEAQRVRVSVNTQPNSKDKTIQENVVSRGTSTAPSCGLLSWKENCENDLEG